MDADAHVGEWLRRTHFRRCVRVRLGEVDRWTVEILALAEEEQAVLGFLKGLHYFWEDNHAIVRTRAEILRSVCPGVAAERNRMRSKVAIRLAASHKSALWALALLS